MDLLLASFNLVSTVDLPTRLQNNSATAIDNIFIGVSLQANYVIYPLCNGLSDLYCLQTNLTIYQRGPYYFGIKLFNHLLSSIKELACNAKRFKRGLKRLLNTLNLFIPGMNILIRDSFV
jgi:hypothetical protein